MLRTEIITRGDCPPVGELAPGVGLRVFASGQLGARGLSTGTATFPPGGALPYHTHPFSEVITLITGQAEAQVEGRRYQLLPFDALHVPRGVAHQTRNPASDSTAIVRWSFASDTPTRELVADRFPVIDRTETGPDCPESLVRFDRAKVYELAPRVFFRDLFGGRFGARGICGGYGLFEPGAELPGYIYGGDVAITIVTGRAVCQAAGKEYALTNCDTVFIPAGMSHGLVNRTDQPMAIIWVGAGDEPDRAPLNG